MRLDIKGQNQNEARYSIYRAYLRGGSSSGLLKPLDAGHHNGNIQRRALSYIQKVVMTDADRSVCSLGVKTGHSPLSETLLTHIAGDNHHVICHKPCHHHSTATEALHKSPSLLPRDRAASWQGMPSHITVKAGI